MIYNTKKLRFIKIPFHLDFFTIFFFNFLKYNYKDYYLHILNKRNSSLKYIKLNFLSHVLCN